MEIPVKVQTPSPNFTPYGMASFVFGLLSAAINLYVVGRVPGLAGLYSQYTSTKFAVIEITFIWAISLVPAVIALGIGWPSLRRTYTPGRNRSLARAGVILSASPLVGIIVLAAAL